MCRAGSIATLQQCDTPHMLPRTVQGMNKHDAAMQAEAPGSSAAEVFSPQNQHATIYTRTCPTSYPQHA